MDQQPNGEVVTLNGNSHKYPPEDAAHLNGTHEISLEELEKELPMVTKDQALLGDLVSRMAQAIYAELTELAETMPNMSDALRKRTLADFVVKTKKQVVKLYVVAKWARDAEAVLKAMNITAFILEQNRQLGEAIDSLQAMRDDLNPARLRNHDLLTSLDVLTTGTYRQLPTAIKKFVVPPAPLSDEEVAKILSNMEDAIRYRLRMNEIIPPEMASYRIAGGRVHFTVPKLFTASLCLLGAHHEDGWFFADVEFLFNVGGDTTGMEDFPRHPQAMHKRLIADEADQRLKFYLPMPPDPNLPPGVELPPRPQLPEGVVDAPLVRVFNFLQMMSMSYQLEILWYQAQRLRSLGWADYLKVEMSNDRKTLTISYWVRQPVPIVPGRPPPRVKLPPMGGTLTISIVPTQPAPPNPSPLPHGRTPSIPQHSQTQTQSSLHPSQSQPSQASSSTSPPLRKPKARILLELQERAKLGAKVRPSDEVEGVKFSVKWEPQPGTLGVPINPQYAQVAEGELEVDADDLDVEALIQKVIRKHARAILSVFRNHLQRGQQNNAFNTGDETVFVDDENTAELRVRLCADEVAVITIDPRTGRLVLKDTGDLAAASRSQLFAKFSERVNENPLGMANWLSQLRFSIILDIVEQKANYLGLQNFRTRALGPEQMAKLGANVRGTLFIQLHPFPSHYFVIVIRDHDFEYALIAASENQKGMHGMFPEMVMNDIGWLMVDRLYGNQVVVKPRQEVEDMIVGRKRKRPPEEEATATPNPRPRMRFDLETNVLRELYSYCCARVAYAKVEMQLKSRGLPYKHFDPWVNPSPELAHIHSSIARSIPAMVVDSADILAGAPAAEAAMPYIRVIPLNWWCERKAQVVTCVKLKYVQQPVGKRAGGAIIRPSNRIIYDTSQAVVTFVSEDVTKCVTEFLQEWAKVSKMVVIAREIAQMATEKAWRDVRLLSFDLQTVEFAYSGDYAVSITCTDQLSPTGGSYELHFSRASASDADAAMDTSEDGDIDQYMAHYNPHEDIEPFVRDILRHGRLAQSLHRLVALLRDTLPIVTELEYIRVSASKAGDHVETFAKTAGWYRVLFGDRRHALDFRLMSDARVAILDGARTLFPDALALADKKPPLAESALTLRTIPSFESIVAATCREVLPAYNGSKVTRVDIGVVCHSTAVQAVGRLLYSKVQEALKAGGTVKQEPS